MKIIRTRLITKGFAFTFAQIIFIHPESPEYLIPHEMVHVEQQARDGWRWYVRYYFTPGWKLDYEIPAHKAAVAAGEPLEQAALELANNYSGIKIEFAEAVALLG